MSENTLNAQEQRVLEYIKKQIKDTGYPPSVREICAALDLSLHLLHINIYGDLQKKDI